MIGTMSHNGQHDLLTAGARPAPTPGAVGTALAQARRQKGVTSQAVAWDLAVGYSTYRSWEAGRRMPPRKYYARLREVLGLDLTQPLPEVPPVPGPAGGWQVRPLDGERLPAYLERVQRARGETQPEMAAFLGVSAGCYSHWIRGRNYPRRGEVPRLAARLGLAVAQFPAPPPRKGSHADLAGAREVLRRLGAVRETVDDLTAPCNSELQQVVPQVINEPLKAWMDRRQWTVKRLAAISGLSVELLDRLCKDSRQRAAVPVIGRLAEVFRVDVPTFLAGPQDRVAEPVQPLVLVWGERAYHFPGVTAGEVGGLLQQLGRDVL